MSEPVKPALTEKEWVVAPDIEHLMTFEIASDILPEGIIGRHGAAALALYGQPFGFTQEDVRELRSVYNAYMSGDWGNFSESDPWVIAIKSLADRISALLPPEEPKP